MPLSFVHPGATADPQSLARHLPVAVVDEDEGASLDTPVGERRVDMGSQITAGMMRDYDWSAVRLHMVDAYTAEEAWVQEPSSARSGSRRI